LNTFLWIKPLDRGHCAFYFSSDLLIFAQCVQLVHPRELGLVGRVAGGIAISPFKILALKLLGVELALDALDLSLLVLVCPDGYEAEQNDCQNYQRLYGDYSVFHCPIIP
jgi:hypothetical protein